MPAVVEKMTLKSCTSAFLVPFVLCATGLFVLLSAGCDKKGGAPAKPAVDRSSPESYMHDETFRKKVSTQRHEVQALAARLKPLKDRMQALVAAHGEDPAKLEKIPEWNELHKKVTELNEQLKAARREQLSTVRDRITPVKK